MAEENVTAKKRTALSENGTRGAPGATPPDPPHVVGSAFVVERPFNDERPIRRRGGVQVGAPGSPGAPPGFRFPTEQLENNTFFAVTKTLGKSCYVDNLSLIHI